jgi:hypothetical protein
MLSKEPFPIHLQQYKEQRDMSTRYAGAVRNRMHHLADFSRLLHLQAAVPVGPQDDCVVVLRGIDVAVFLTSFPGYVLPSA